MLFKDTRKVVVVLKTRELRGPAQGGPLLNQSGGLRAAQLLQVRDNGHPGMLPENPAQVGNGKAETPAQSGKRNKFRLLIGGGEKKQQASDVRERKQIRRGVRSAALSGFGNQAVCQSGKQVPDSGLSLQTRRRSVRLPQTDQLPQSAGQRRSVGEGQGGSPAQ